MDNSTLTDLISHYPTQEDVIALMTSNTQASEGGLPCVHNFFR